jgi:hypothetical protein
LKGLTSNPSIIEKPGGGNTFQGRSAKRLIPPLEMIEGVDRKPLDHRKHIPGEEREALDSSSGDDWSD